MANSILVKVNQIGTLTEAFDAIEMAKKARIYPVISTGRARRRDSFIADIAVGNRTENRAPCRSDRVTKYITSFLRIEEQLR